MKQAEFDKFADEYASEHARNITASGEAPEYFHEYKVRDLAAMLRARSAPVRDVLDFGTGVGNSLQYFRRYFPDASLSGVDVSPRCLEIARSRAPEARLLEFDGITLPFPAASFDVAFAACVFHHIPAAEHGPLLREIHRVLRPGGTLAIYEHNPLNPLTRHAVNTCPFDRDARLLRAGEMRAALRDAGFARVQGAYKIFFPHFVAALRPLEAVLGWCALGAQYRASGVKEPPAD
jgi:SAM-dependent methyltransferase